MTAHVVATDHVNGTVHVATHVGTSSLGRPFAATKCWLNWVQTPFVVTSAPATCRTCTKV